MGPHQKWRRRQYYIPWLHWTFENAANRTRGYKKTEEGWNQRPKEVKKQSTTTTKAIHELDIGVDVKVFIVAIINAVTEHGELGIVDKNGHQVIIFKEDKEQAGHPFILVEKDGIIKNSTDSWVIPSTTDDE